jgi:Gram-negative bacterial TonB protein C-terminal
MILLEIGQTSRFLSRDPRPPFTEYGALRLFVRGESFFANCRDSLAVLASRPGVPSSASPNYLFRQTGLTRARFPGGSLGAAALVHCLFLALLVYSPRFMPVETSPRFSAHFREERIYYRVPLLDPAKLPRIAPAGPGGRPGSGSVHTPTPALGSTAFRPSMTIISKPIHPDNSRQTIYQPSSPPEMRIAAEQKVPNIVSLPQVQAPKATLNFDIGKPIQNARKLPQVTAPSVEANSAAPMTTLLKPSNTQPRLAIPLAGDALRLQSPRNTPGSASGAAPTQTGEIVALGVDPGAPTDQISLPGGNRWGEFSIGSSGAKPGAPGGSPSGTEGGGSGTVGLGGDASIGLGSGGSGGGGGNSGTSGTLSIAGPGAGNGSGGMLDPISPANMVFPVPRAIALRRNGFVVSAGPVGGGGLNVYGALHCGTIYSIFLPMPGKNWSLQYCEKSSGTQKAKAEAPTTIMHLEKPLIPPDVDLSQRFDFKRLPLPVDNSHRTIVLQGVIAIDGTVQHLVVHQGVLPNMDEAARIAFSRWVFKPAVRDGKPVEVEILVGIPPLTEEDRVNR